MDPDNQGWKQILKMQAIGLVGALLIWGIIFGVYMVYALTMLRPG